MPNEAEHELIAGVMTSDWLGCGLLGQEKLRMANCGARWAEAGTLWVTEQRKLDFTQHFMCVLLKHILSIRLLCYEQAW